MIVQTEINIEGQVSEQFGGVADIFRRNFTDRGEVGAAVCVHHNGRKVVDLWAGVADVDTGRPWRADTLSVVFSSTKGAAAACALMLVDRGLIDVDAPVARYWPEFAAGGKESIPIRWILSHRAGLPAVDRPLTKEDVVDGGPLAEAIAEQTPVWEPGTKHGYHALTFGTILDQLVRRTDGRRLAQFFADEIAGPLGLDFWIGLPTDEHPRVCSLIEPEEFDIEQIPEPLREIARAAMDPSSLTMRALFAHTGLNLFSDFNQPWVWSSEVPAGGAVTDARSLSRMYSGLLGNIDGVELLSRQTLDAARTTEIRGPDEVLLMMESHWGLGFQLPIAALPLGGEGSFGHSGAGGSFGMGDPETGLSFGYVPNRMRRDVEGTMRSRDLVAAAYTAIGRTI